MTKPWKARYVALAAGCLIGAYATLAHAAEHVDMAAVCAHLNEEAPADDFILHVAGRVVARCTMTKRSAEPLHYTLPDWNMAELWALNHGNRVVWDIGPEDDDGVAAPPNAPNKNANPH